MNQRPRIIRGYCLRLPHRLLELDDSEDGHFASDEAILRSDTGRGTGSGHAETVSGGARVVLWDDLLYYSGAFCLLYSQRQCFGRRLMLATG